MRSNTRLEEEKMRVDIDRTRERVVDDLVALSTKMSRDNFKQQAKHSLARRKQAGAERASHAAERARGGAQRALARAKDNKLPVAVAGASAVALGAWALKRRKQARAEFEPYGEGFDAEYGEPIMEFEIEEETAPARAAYGHPEPGQKAPSEGIREPFQRLVEPSEFEPSEFTAPPTGAAGLAQERARQRHHAREPGYEQPNESKARQMGQAVAKKYRGKAESARRIGRQARRKGREQAYKTSGIISEHPVATLLIALAAGAGVASLLPQTKKQRQWLGSKGHELKGYGRDKLHRFRKSEAPKLEEFTPVVEESTTETVYTPEVKSAPSP